MKLDSIIEPNRNDSSVDNGDNNSMFQADNQRLLQLDVLRGIAILLVLGHHPPVSGQQAGLFTPLAYWWEFIGWSGVDLFFVLSGFLIGGLLFKELRVHGELNLSRFYVRRCLRIWPPYYVCIAVAFLIVLIRNHGDFSGAFHIMWGNFLHIQNYVRNPQRPVGQSWSLAVEEHFYLFLPLLITFLWRCQKRFASDKIPTIPLIAFVITIVCTTWRWNSYYSPDFNMFASHLRIDGLFWGVLLAYLFYFDPNKLTWLAQRPIVLLVLAALFLSPMFFLQRSTSGWMYSVGLTMLYGGYGCLLLAFLYSSNGGSWTVKFFEGRLARFISWIGIYSYTIYLWFGILGSKPIMAIFNRFKVEDPTLNWLCQFFTYLIFSVLGGVVMAKLVDNRILKYREKLFPARVHILSNNKESPQETEFKVG